MGTIESELYSSLYYTATQARRVLGGIEPQSLMRLVNEGLIVRVVPPQNKRRGVYTRASVDRLAAKQQAFSHGEPDPEAVSITAVNLRMKWDNEEDGVVGTVSVFVNGEWHRVIRSAFSTGVSLDGLRHIIYKEGA